MHVYIIHHAMKNMRGERSVSRLGYFTPGENTVPSSHPIEGSVSPKTELEFAGKAEVPDPLARMQSLH